MKDTVRILVTGGTGFVGSSIVAELVKAGKFELFGVARKVPQITSAEYLSKIKLFEADISDYKTLQTLEGLGNVEVLVHAAGLAHQFGKTTKQDFWAQNVRGTENVGRLADVLKVGHLILISSVSVYGNHGDVEVDESFECRPVGYYAESKLEAERTATEYCENRGIRLTVLRLATVVGEGDRGNVARLITAIDQSRFVWIGEGNNKKSLIYKNDVGKAVLKLVEVKEKLGTEIYNLTSEPVSMKEIVGIISANLRKQPLSFKIPEQIIRGIFWLNEKTFSFEFLTKTNKTVNKWLSNDRFSGKALFENYDFKPQTPVPEAISRQVRAYLEQKQNKGRK